MYYCFYLLHPATRKEEEKMGNMEPLKLLLVMVSDDGVEIVHSTLSISA